MIAALCFQTILFTKDPNILELILANDKNFQALLKDNQPSESIIEKRPLTANDSNHNISPVGLLEGDAEEKETKYIAKVVKITAMSNWGQRHLIGLTGKITYLFLPYVPILSRTSRVLRKHNDRRIVFAREVSVEFGYRVLKYRKLNLDDNYRERPLERSSWIGLQILQ